MRVLLGVAAVGVLVLGGCGGKITNDSDLVISDNESGLGATGASEADDGDRADDDCRDEDHDGHKHHRRHWFKVLDKLDGTRDKRIVIGSLPAGLPDRLIAKLQKLDRNGDGVVTRREVKGHRHHDDGDRDDQGDDERDDD